MSFIDYLVLAVYFVGMGAIGVWAMKRTAKQEDYFMGGRKFGKWLQTFAAFGAGTGSADPVNTARTTFTSGMSGMWSVMYWLFVTPVYWISGVWYRRMRCLTLGDWYVERYESRSIGVAYAAFGILYYMVYGAMLFSAIGKVAAPLMGNTLPLFGGVNVEYVLVPVVAIVVLVYGILGGLTAAYWTDVIQGICIIILSVLLLPFGLVEISRHFGGSGLMSGFRIMHEQLPETYFTIVGSGAASQFPLHSIIAITIINMVGIVVTPHFIATGGGSAKSEFDARVGLVTGNFIKRFCTIGWVLTALIALTLYADNLALSEDPDKTWGFATMQLLGPLGIGLVGLMMACLMAALMSSIDTYMLVCSALVVRNVYVPFINPKAGDRECVKLGRITGGIVVFGAVVMALSINDVFKLLQITWIVPLTFAAPFWIGMYWRRATTRAAWCTVAFCLLTFFVLPKVVPALAPGLRASESLTRTNHIVTTTTHRPAAPSDVARRFAQIARWDEQQAAGAANPGTRPDSLAIGDRITEVSTTGGKAIYWDSVQPVGERVLREIDRVETGDTLVVTSEYDCPLEGKGEFRLDLLLYRFLGIDLTQASNATLGTLDLPFKILAPFLVMILFSLFTARNSESALDRFYVKMKTPVDPDPETDVAEIARSYSEPKRFDDRKWVKHPDFEFQRPTKTDFWGFVICCGVCFAIIGLTFIVAQIGA